MPGTRAGDDRAARYAALYREHNGRLVAYARSLTGSEAVAEDLAAEAHFRVWRRIQAGYEVDNVAAYLTATVRNLAAGLSGARREIARDGAELPGDPARDAGGTDPERRASHVDLITRLLKELPERWAKALWYAEVEDLSMEEVGERIGANAGTAAAVLARARERLRQAFLQSQPGTPLDVACEPYWKQLPATVRRTASPRRAKSVIDHCDECADCHARLLALTEANTRLPALLGPAIFAGVLGGGSWLLPAVTGTATAATAGAATAVRATVRTGSKARHARISPRTQLLRHGLSPTKTVVVSSAAAVGIVATVATLTLGSTTASSQTPAALSPVTAPGLIQPSGAAGRSATSSGSTPTATASTVAQPTSAAPASTTAPQQTSAPYSVSSQSQSAAATTDPTTVAATSPTSPATSPDPSASSTPTIVSGPIMFASPSASSTSPAPTESPTASPTATPTPTPTSASPSASPSDSASATASYTPSFTPTPTFTSSLSPSASPLCTLSIIGTCATETPGND